MTTSDRLDHTKENHADPGAVPCPRCKYDLRGQVEPRCPECNFQFISIQELRNRQLTAEEKIQSVLYWRNIGLITFAISCLTLPALLLLSNGLRFLDTAWVWSAPFVAASACNFFIAVTVIRCRLDSTIDRARRRKLNASIVVLAFSSLAFLGALAKALSCAINVCSN